MRVLVLFLALAISSCSSQQHNKIIDVVAQLPEVAFVEKHIKASTERRSALKLWIHEQSSENTKNLWWVKAGEDNGENVTTHLNFKLNEAGTQVWFYEILSDSLIPMDK